MALRALIDILNGAGVSALKDVVDLGDINCVATLADISALDVSGAGASAMLKSSCTFNGTPGNKSATEFASRSGASRMEAASHDAWQDALHKDNAVFSLLLAVFVPTGLANSSTYMFIGNVQFSGSTRQGVAIGTFVNSSGVASLSFLVGTAASHSGALNKGSTVPLVKGAWNLIQISMNEASATGCDVMVNGRNENSSAVYASPSGSNAVRNWRFFSTMDDNSFSAPSGLGIAAFAVSQGAGAKWTVAQMSAIFNELGLRHGRAPEPRMMSPLSDFGYVPGAPGVPSLGSGFVTV